LELIIGKTNQAHNLVDALVAHNMQAHSCLPILGGGFWTKVLLLWVKQGTCGQLLSQFE